VSPQRRHGMYVLFSGAKSIVSPQALQIQEMRSPMLKRS
jgi:hypothetical protein